MSDRPSTEADRLEALAETIRISGKAARDHIRALNFDRARVWERIITEKLADLVLGLRYQTDDGVVMCEQKVCGQLFESTGDDMVMTRAAKGPSMSSPGEPPEYEVMCPECRDKDDDLYAYDEGDYAEERDA